MSELVIYEGMTALDVFKPDAVKEIISGIEKEVDSFKPDTSTDKGRKAIASLAYKVSQSKTLLEKAGKELVSGWKEQSKAVDTHRKELRDGLDLLRDKARQPLTDWEDSEKEREAAGKLAAEIAEAHGFAISENDLFNREKDMAEKEEAARVAEEAKAEAARHEQAKLDQIARDERIKEEAATAERERAAKELADAEERIKQADRDRIASEERAKLEAEAATTRQAEAVEQAKLDEAERLRVIEDGKARKAELERQTIERAAQNKAHQRAINKKAVADIVLTTGITEAQAVAVITAIAKKQVAMVSINY